ncbi:LPS export ABC transporter periplasmic protein LptC [Candidatus Avelusimicrobium faecicola]|uniref:LPS export ABC transporter periplasmic protein LptC n=1 Tax=Candidatus Avelusimicrobium faecicola TaxID=3416205 RepID=UPI003D122A8B
MKLHYLVILSVLCPALAFAQDQKLPAPPGQDGFIYFTADNASVDPVSKKVNLKGNVVITQETKDKKHRVVTGEDITLDQAKTQISSAGTMTVKTADATLTGQDMSVNYTTKDFTAHNIATQYPPLRVINAKEISSKNGKEVLRGATLTCCDKPDPHYTLSVGKLSVSPEKRVFGTNAIMRLDGWPVLYVPVFWRSLESQKPFTTHVDFTQSKKIGFGVLTSTVFDPVLGFRPKLNLDYYTKSGVGIGTELLAVTTPTLQGTGEFYYIHDNASPVELGKEETNRWGVRGGYWLEMADSSDHLNNEHGALYQLQTQFRMVSDPYFNDSFFRGNPYIFMPDQQTNFSVSRQTRRSTLRVSYDQQDIYDWNKMKFIAQTRTLPEIKYMLHPVNLLGLSHRVEAGLDNTSYMEESFRRSGNARWTAEKAVRLARGFTFTPSVFYDQTVTFADPQYESKDSWVGRIGTDLNVQTETLLGTTDFGYRYTKRLSTNTVTTDQHSLDRGEERNKIYLSNYYRPSFNTYVRFETGFNLANTTTNLQTGVQRELGWEHLKSRVEPLLLEGGYNSPSGNFRFFVQDIYDLQEKNQAFITQLDFIYKRQIIGFGLNNFANHEDIASQYRTYSDRYTFTTSLGIRPNNPNWFIDGGFDFQIQDKSFTGFNKMLRVSRTFHDARLELTVRDRNQNLSFAFRVNVLCGGDPRKQRALPEDQYWYPWRSENDLRDM